jgi:hypothetical protein
LAFAMPFIEEALCLGGMVQVKLTTGLISLNTPARLFSELTLRLTYYFWIKGPEPFYAFGYSVEIN